MKRFPWNPALILTLLTLTGNSLAGEPGAPSEPDFGGLLRRIETLQEEGQLAEADSLVGRIIESRADEFDSPQRRQLEYELDRSRRIRRDYPLTESALLESLSQGIRGFTGEDFQRWKAAGYFDFKVIDGQARYFESSRSNLFFRYPEISARRVTPRAAKPQRERLAHARQVIKGYLPAGQFLGEPYPQRVRMTITVEGNAVKQGEMIRCWMPYPGQFSAQTGVRLLESTPKVKWIGRGDYPMRSLYFEQKSKGAKPTVFTAEYTFTGYSRYQPIDVSVVGDTSQEAFCQFDYFTREQAPHVVFDEEIRRLAKTIADGETNPYMRARRYYDWISRNTKYSYAREYSTLRNISRYVLEHGYGDCGQHALLLITLCRAGGIPARWQSGWTVSPHKVGMHDWTEIHIEPYGWLPVDPDYAVSIVHEYQALSAEEKAELIDFYFGGIDAYRLIINREHGYPLYPAKKFHRSDDVDFQRGEVETETGNVYYDQFRYKLERLPSGEEGRGAGN